MTCPFCELDKEKTRVLSESKHSFVILSNLSLVRGHCLVIPKKHVEKLSELNKEEIDDLILEVINFQENLLKKFGGCDIRQNYRPFQKQDDLKVHHLHIHLQPRELEDELYKKSQINEREIFHKLNNEELEEIKNFLLK
jgi:histidine triad (HIT) family protein